MSEFYEELREFYLREAEKDTRKRKWRRFRQEALVVLVACAIVALFVWGAGIGR